MSCGECSDEEKNRFEEQEEEAEKILDESKAISLDFLTNPDK